MTSVYSLYFFFCDCWDFAAGGGKRRHANPVAMHGKETMSAEELISLQYFYPGAS